MSNIFNGMDSQQRMSQLNKLFKNLLGNQMGVEYNLDYNSEKPFYPYVLTVYVDPNKFYRAMGADTLGEHGESEYWGLMNTMDGKINNIIKYVGMEEDSVNLLYDDKFLSETQEFIQHYIKSNFYKILDGLVNNNNFKKSDLPKLEKVKVYRGSNHQPHLNIEILLSGNHKFGDFRIIENEILQTLDLDEFLLNVDFQ